MFINGKPAARMGDPTDHGGVIVMGNPTVVIGDQGIVIGGSGVIIGSSVVVGSSAASPTAAAAHTPGPVNGIGPANYQQQAAAGASFTSRVEALAGFCFVPALVSCPAVVE